MKTSEETEPEAGIWKRRSYIMRILIGENPAKAMNEFCFFSEVRFVFNVRMSRQHIAVKVFNSAILIDTPRTNDEHLNVIIAAASFLEALRYTKLISIGKNEECGSRVGRLVAGAGFEPAAFRL